MPCDNGFVMRLNSDADATLLRAAPSFVPAGLLLEAPASRQGEAVVAGKVAPHAAIVRFGAHQRRGRR